MIVITIPGVCREDIENKLQELKIGEVAAIVTEENGRTLLSIPQPAGEEAVLALEALPWVDTVVKTESSYHLVARSGRTATTRVDIGPVTVGGQGLVVIAGPCAVENYEQLKETALRVKQSGAAILRGGAFKPRTSPYSFQGLEEEGLRILQAVGTEVQMPVVSEVLDPRHVEMITQRVDLLQIGARSMYNTALLKEVGRQKKPVLLKRSAQATYDEWLQAAEYIAMEGNAQIILCERGIRTFEPYTRNTLDLAAVPAIKHLSHLPIVVDPSHGTGRWRMVSPMALAAVATGADGIMVEVHPHPESALSDGGQSLQLNRFDELMKQIKRLMPALGRNLEQVGERD